MSDSFYRCTPRQVRKFAEEIMEAGLVPNIQSSPGMGKSSIVRAICQAWNLEMIDVRLSTCAPEDLSGLPWFNNGKAEFLPFDIFPLEDTPLPEGKDGWAIFYDEFNSGTKMVQAASYKVILDKMVGQRRLNERVAQVCAGNLITDRAITSSLSTAMQSRLVHIEMQLSHPEWLEDVALKEGYDERIIAYLSYDDKKLMDFRPDHDEKTFCCPRTWEFMNRLIRGKSFDWVQRNGQEVFTMLDKTPLYAGTITSGVAAEFVGFCALQKELVTIRDVLADPSGADVPQEAQRKWIVVSHLIGQTDSKNFDDVCTYVNRMDVSFRVLFFRSAMVQHASWVRSHPAFAKAMIELAKYLNRN